MSRLRELDVVCVLRSGGDYDAAYVNRLYRNFKHFTNKDKFPYVFNVLTDFDESAFDEGIVVRPLMCEWSGWWSKMELFHPEHFDRDIFYMDLDTVIVGPTDVLMYNGALMVLEDFYKGHHYIGSGLMYIPVRHMDKVWNTWIENPQRYIHDFRGDQDFLQTIWRDFAERWQYTYPGKVLSYKKDIYPQKYRYHKIPEGHVEGKIPEDASIICFHGFPRPHQVEDEWVRRWFDDDARSDANIRS